MANVTATKSTRRTLLAETSLAPFVSKAVTSISVSGTTASVVCTGHGFTTNDWVLMGGATAGVFNGPFQVTVVDANDFTFVVPSGSPASASGTLTAQKGLAAAIWGDGSTGLAGCALPTAVQALLSVRIVNGATAPTTVPTAGVWTSDTGGSGTWIWQSNSPAGTSTNLGDTGGVGVDVSGYRFVLAFFFGAAGYAVNCSAYGLEITYAVV